MSHEEKRLDIRFWLALGLLAGLARDANAEGLMITVKLVKQSAGMARSEPTLCLLSARDQWTVRRGPTWSGENPWEIFFVLQAAHPQAELPKVSIAAPGVTPRRVLVGKQDVPFEHHDGLTTFALVRDTRNSMLLNQILLDPEGGHPIHVYHNWLIRQDGPYRGKPRPEVEVKAVLNYLVAAREALKIMGGVGPRDKKEFQGEITLMGFEVACARGHNDYPPHVHIMLWVPGYVGGEVPHFHMDAAGKIVRNSFGILGDVEGKFSDRAPIIAEKNKRSGIYGPGRPCPLFDLDGRLAICLTITPEGGLLLSRRTDAPPQEAYLLIGDGGRPHEAVVVRHGNRDMVRAKVNDDAERGQMDVSVEHLRDGVVIRTVRQQLLYDPFSGLERKP